VRALLVGGAAPSVRNAADAARVCIEMTSGIDDVLEGELPPGPVGAAEPPIGVYAESEEDVTQFVETPRPEPKWIVQITPFDRRQMSTEGLLRELRRGQLVHRESLVWRGGSADWQPIARVDELQTQAGAPSAAAPSGPSGRWRGALGRIPRRVPAVVAAGLAALLAGALTLYALAWAGAFEPGGHKGRSAMANETPR